MGLDFTHIVIVIAAIVVAITLHELAHALAADRLGDPTPRRQGRISISPLDHFDVIGFAMIVFTTISGFGIGWGKPVMVNPGNFRNPRRDHGLVAAAGPASNIIQACVFAALYHALSAAGAGDQLLMFLLTAALVNLILAFFNLIPLGPLDGASVLTAYLPHRQAWQFRSWSDRYGNFAFLILILIGCQTGILGMVIGPPVAFCMRALGLSG